MDYKCLKCNAKMSVDEVARQTFNVPNCQGAMHRGPFEGQATWGRQTRPEVHNLRTAVEE